MKITADKICPGCHNPSPERTKRVWWMRLLPGSKHYKCGKCSTTFITFQQSEENGHPRRHHRQSQDREDRRRHPRLRLHLPAQGRMDEENYHHIEITDISATGLRLRSANLQSLIQEPGNHRHRVEFEIRVIAELAWTTTDGESTFVSGWKFVHTPEPEDG